MSPGLLFSNRICDFENPNRRCRRVGAAIWKHLSTGDESRFENTPSVARSRVSRCPLNQSFGILKLNAQTGQNRYGGFQRRLPLGYFPDILLDISGRFIISDASQKQALKNYRKRLHQRGMARFEVLGLNADRELIRSLAKRLADKDPEATRIRTAVRRTIAGGPPKKGGILDALRRSPLVGAGLDLTRPLTAARKVAL